MSQSERVIVQNFDSAVPLNQNQSGWYMEELIENYTNATIYVLRPNGKLYSVPPLYNMPVPVKRVVVKSLIRVGLPLGSSYSGTNTVAAPKSPVVETIIDYDRLAIGPYYSAEIGIGISLEIHKAELISSNCLNPDYVDARLRERIDEYVRKGPILPIVVRANSHDQTLKFLYIVINGNVSTVKIEHRLNEKEILEFCLNKDDRSYVVSIDGDDLDWSKLDCREQEIIDHTWIFGTDENKVRDQLSNLIKDKQMRLTSAEVTHRIEQATISYKQDIENLNKTLEQTKKELDIARKDLETTKGELAKANDASKVSTLQEMNAMKLANTAEEIKLTNERRMLAKEQAEFSEKMEKAKAEAEQKIQEAKVRKEEASVSKAEIENSSATVKAAAVIAPVALGAGLWFMSHAQVSSILAAVASLSNPVTVGIAAGAVACALISEPVREFCKKIIPASKRFLSGCKNLICEAGEVITGVCKSGISVVKNFVNTISEGLCSIGSFFCSIFS